MNKLCIFAFGVFLFALFQNALVANAEPVLKEDFERRSLAAWRSFSTDEGSKSGWTNRQGTAAQEAFNVDEATGGERLLFKPQVLNWKTVECPIDISVDVSPGEVSRDNEVRYGVCFLIDPIRPKGGEILACLTKERESDRFGVEIVMRGKYLASKPTPCDLEANKWHRLLTRLESYDSGKSIKVKVKAWNRDDVQPDNWMTETTLSAPTLAWDAPGLGLICYAEQGNRKNPRARFDNLTVSSPNAAPDDSQVGQDSIQPSLTGSEKKVRDDFRSGEQNLPWEFKFNEDPV